MPRGTFLKNSDWAIGLVVYTGVDTKMMLNAKIKKKPKIGRIEKYLTRFVAQIFVVQLGIAFWITLMGFSVTDLSYVQLSD